jgi:hypothetical protein
MIDALNIFRNSISSHRSENGQVLPGIVFLIALLSFIAFSLIHYLNQAANLIYRIESNTLLESEDIINSHTALNGLVLNNLKLQSQLFRLLNIVDTSLTDAVSISSSALLWENKLPIPRPHDVFEMLSAESRMALQLSRFVSFENNKLVALAKNSGQVNVRVLSLGQSLCQMPCLQNLRSRNSDPVCQTKVEETDSCLVAGRLTSGLKSHFDSVPLKSLFPSYIWNSPGFVIIEKRVAIKKSRAQGSGFTSEIVHPALCETQFTNFKLPCLTSLFSAAGLASTKHRLSFLPHWSVAFEKSAQ